jgi:hypothetical protein
VADMLLAVMYVQIVELALELVQSMPTRRHD